MSNLTWVCLVISFLWWTGTMVFAFWWAERRFLDGYQEGYQDGKVGRTLPIQRKIYE